MLILEAAAQQNWTTLAAACFYVFMILTFKTVMNFLHGTPLEKSQLDFYGLSLETTSFFLRPSWLVILLIVS